MRDSYITVLLMKFSRKLSVYDLGIGFALAHRGISSNNFEEILERYKIQRESNPQTVQDT